jgi:hypothetical protein
VVFHEQAGAEAEAQNDFCYVSCQNVHLHDHKSPFLGSGPVSFGLCQHVTYVGPIHKAVYTRMHMQMCLMWMKAVDLSQKYESRK